MDEYCDENKGSYIILNSRLWKPIRNKHGIFLAPENERTTGAPANFLRRTIYQSKFNYSGATFVSVGISCM